MTRRRSTTVAAAVALLSIAFGSTAHAQTTARAALDAGLFAYEHHGAETKMLAQPTGGIRGALGYAFELSPRWYLGPEASLGYLKVGDAYARNILRAQAGARVAWLASEHVATNLFLHLGYGYARGIDDDAALLRHGPLAEVGGAFDFRVSPSVAIGPDVIVGTMLARTGHPRWDVTPWVLGGFHVSAVFGGSSEVATAVARR